MTKSDNALRICGRVVDHETKLGLSDLRVEAWDKDVLFDDLLAAGQTDHDGGFVFEVPQRRFTVLERKPDVYFKVFRGPELITSTKSSVLPNVTHPGAEMTIEVGARPAAQSHDEAVNPDAVPTSPEAPVRPESPQVFLGSGGAVVNATSGHAVCGLEVTARPYAYDCPPDLVVADGATDERGRFTLRARNTLAARRALVLIDAGEVAYVLHGAAPDGQLYPLSKPIYGLASPPVTLRLDVAVSPVPDDVWRKVGERIDSARITRLHEVASELLAPAAQSVFADLALETRHDVLSCLERAFLDSDGTLTSALGPPPSFDVMWAGGLDAYRERLTIAFHDPAVAAAFDEFLAKAESFPDLRSVDWLIDSEEIKEGRIGAGVNKFRDTYLSEDGLRAMDESAAQPAPDQPEPIQRRT